MKKNNIFRHELNESIQANAAMNCLKNRNKHQQNEGFLMTAGIWVLKKIVFHLVMKAIKKYGSQIDFSKVMDSVANGLAEQKGALQKAVGKAVNGWQDLPEKYKNQITELAKEKFNELKSAAGEKINQMTSKGQPQLATQEQEETSDFDARFEFRKDLRELASPAAKKAYMIIRKKYGDNMWRQLYMDDCDERGLIDMLNTYAEDGLQPQQIVNKMLGSSEDEETVNYAQLADDVCASYRGPLSKLDLKDSINYIIKMVAKKIGKTVDALTPQELTAIQKAAKHSVWYVSEQEESSLDTEYFSDLEEQEAYYKNFRAIAKLVADQIDRGNGKDIDNNMDTLFEIIREIWNNNSDDLYIWDFDDVQEKDCYKFFDKYYETIKNEYLKREHNNIMAATHDDLFASEQEELPQMERHDMILALSEYMSESWIATDDEDGDLDDIYYAIADILDRTGDYPASTSWEDCKPWCQKHYREVEARIY